MKRTFFNHMKHGITRLHNRKGKITKEYLYLYDKPIVYKEFFYNTDTISNPVNTSFKIQNYRVLAIDSILQSNIIDSMQQNGRLIMTNKQVPNPNISLYYLESRDKDTICMDEPYNSTISLINVYNWDLRLELGYFDDQLNFESYQTYISDSTIHIELMPQALGLNLVTGKLYASIETEINGNRISTERVYVFYTEFYVIEKN